MNDNHFTITFNTAELLGAATALGLAVLPVQARLDLSDMDLQKEIQRGYALLQQRGLVGALSAMRWEVDNLVAILVHWLASPDSELKVEMWQSEHGQQEAIFYFWQGQALCLQSEANTHRLTLFRTEEQWIEHCLDWMGGPALSVGELALTLPRLNLVILLAEARQKPTEAESIIQQAGLPGSDARQTVSKLAAVERVVNLTWLSVQGSAKKVTQRALVLSAIAEMWGGNVGEADEVVVLRQFAPRDLVRLLGSERA